MKYVNAGTVTTKMLYDGANCVADYNENDTLLRYYITPMLDENMIINVATAGSHRKYAYINSLINVASADSHRKYTCINSLINVASASSHRKYAYINSLINVASGGSSNADYCYTHDGLGTIREILNTSQTTVNSYDFLAFGTVKGSSTESITNRFKFTGRELDSETASANSTALYYYRARTYDSEIGSFTSRDPIRSVNLYNYVSNKPIIYIDPSGNSKIKFKNCKTCAKDYLLCIMNSVYDAICFAGTQVKYFCEGKRGHEGFPKCFETLESRLNKNWSFYGDTSSKDSQIFDEDNVTENQSEKLNTLYEDIWDMYNVIKDNDLTIQCAPRKRTWGAYKIWSAYASSSGNTVNIGTEIVCNTSTLAKTTISALKYDITKFIAHVLTHEISHMADDVIDTEYILGTEENKKDWAKMEIDKRFKNADSIARFVMTYYKEQAEPCSLTGKARECCCGKDDDDGEISKKPNEIDE